MSWLRKGKGDENCTQVEADQHSFCSLQSTNFNVTSCGSLASFVPKRSATLVRYVEDRPEGVNLRIQTVQSLEDEASRIQKALRIFVRDAAPLNALAGQLGVKGEGQVSFVLIKDGGQGEVEIELPNRYRISPQVASAMRAVPGVIEVELV